MSSALWWWLAAGGIALVTAIVLRVLGARSRCRDVMLDEVKRVMRRGIIEKLTGRGPQARGQMGQLEITVDLHEDRSRPGQSPMWRVLAVGPVRLQHPIEARVGGWQGWIDPWLQLAETSPVKGGIGPAFTLHSEHGASLDHPVVAALLRQGNALSQGALHARPDLMRAEVMFRIDPEDNKGLFAYLHAMQEISEAHATRSTAPPVPFPGRTKSLGSLPRHPRR